MEPMEPSFPFRAGSDAPPGFLLMLLALSGLVRVECDPSSRTLTAGCLLLAPPGARARVRGGAGAAPGQPTPGTGSCVCARVVVCVCFQWYAVCACAWCVCLCL